MKTIKVILLVLGLALFASCTKSSVAPTQPTVTVSYTQDTVSKVYTLTAIVTDPSHVSTGGTWEIACFVNNESFWSEITTTEANGVYTASISYTETQGYFLGGVNGEASLECMFKLEKGSEALTEPQVFAPVP
jgi:hypothetical protein